MLIFKTLVIRPSLHPPLPTPVTTNMLRNSPMATLFVGPAEYFVRK